MKSKTSKKTKAKLSKAKLTNWEKQKQKALDMLDGTIRCPKCDKAISHLTYSMDVKEWGDFDGEYNYNDMGDGGDTRFYCPECNNLLFKEEGKAMKFLKKD